MEFTFSAHCYKINFLHGRLSTHHDRGAASVHHTTFGSCCVHLLSLKGLKKKSTFFPVVHTNSLNTRVSRTLNQESSTKMTGELFHNCTALAWPPRKRISAGEYNAVALLYSRSNHSRFDLETPVADSSWL